jgi:hypothetical protein
LKILSFHLFDKSATPPPDHERQNSFVKYQPISCSCLAGSQFERENGHVTIILLVVGGGFTWHEHTSALPVDGSAVKSVIPDSGPGCGSFTQRYQTAWDGVVSDLKKVVAFCAVFFSIAFIGTWLMYPYAA